MNLRRFDQFLYLAKQKLCMYVLYVTLLFLRESSRTFINIKEIKIKECKREF